MISKTVKIDHLPWYYHSLIWNKLFGNCLELSRQCLALLRKYLAIYDKGSSWPWFTQGNHVTNHGHREKVAIEVIS